MDNKYNVFPEEHKPGEFCYSVFEEDTEQVVARFKFEQDAKRYAKKHNRGIAWFGWTPAFFLKPEINVQ